MRENSLNKRWLYFLMVAAGVMLSTMDSSMVNVALPEIMHSFDLDLSEVKLVVLVYLMVVTVSLVFCGRAADRYGKGRIYFSGITIFTIGSVACSCSPNFTGLVISRAIQGIGASMMMSTGPAILKLTSPKEQLGKTLGMVGIATSCGLMIGPALSGLVLHYFSWRVVFLISLPIVIPAIYIAGTSLIKDVNVSAKHRSAERFDWAGGVLWIAVVSSYVVLLNGSFTGWGINCLIGLSCTAFIFCFLRTEKTAVSPIMPLKLVTKKYYWSSVTTAALSFSSLFVILILLPFYLDYVLAYSSKMIGLTMMALPVSLVIISPLSGWLFDRTHSARYISTAGLLVSSLAVCCFFQLGSDSEFFDVFWRLILLGAGQSIFLAPNSASVLTHVPNAFSGITSGILATARNFGMMTGAALGGTIFSAFYSVFTHGQSLNNLGPQQIDAYLNAQRSSFAVALLLLLIGSAISWNRS